MQLTTAQVWQEIENNIFAVLGMVTTRGEARTAGIVYSVHGRKLYIGSRKTAWKVKHTAQNPQVSLTIPIARRLWFMPWMKIPAATITFSGTAQVIGLDAISAEIRRALYRDVADDPAAAAELAVIEVTPVKDFITYGVGVSLMAMRDTEKARGRAPVA